MLVIPVRVEGVPPVEQYLQNKLDVIQEFIGPEKGAKLMADIYKRIVKV